MCVFVLDGLMIKVRVKISRISSKMGGRGWALYQAENVIVLHMIVLSQYFRCEQRCVMNLDELPVLLKYALKDNDTLRPFYCEVRIRSLFSFFFILNTFKLSFSII